MLFFIVLSPPPVENKVSSTVMDFLIIVINHIFSVVFSCYMEYETEMK